MKKSIEKRLDRVFSEYIRKRDTKNGYGKCCSCGRLTAFEDGDCGHFINRKWRSTRWDESNSHFQCRRCNRFDEGNAAGYALFILDRYGREKVDYLRAVSRETARFTDSEGELMIAEYKQKIKALEA